MSVSAMLDKLSYALARAQKRFRLSAIRNTTLGYDSTIEAGSQVIDSSFGRHSFCGYDCTILNTEIGSFCSIAQNVTIGGAAHPIHFVGTSPVFLSHRDSVKTKFSTHVFEDLPRTKLGHDVWVGYRATIRSGVTIGTGAVIGMGAVVTRDVPPYTIVGGNPAREIRRRFSSEVSDALLKSEWWNFDDRRLQAAARHFTNPETFLRSEGLL